MKIYSIALNTIREAIRSRILYLLLIFALLMIASSRIVSLLTVGDELKIIKDIGLISISFFGVLMAVFIGIGLVSKEIEKRTIYNIISKPIQRYQFLLGKYFGLLLTLLINIGIMTILFLIVIYFKSGSWELSMLKAIMLFFFELIIIIAVAILFSTFTTPILSSVFTLAIYIMGQLTPNLLLLREKGSGIIARTTLLILYYLLPNLQNLNIKNEIVHNIAISNQFIFFAVAYSLTYATVVMLLAILLFQKKDFI
jgi:ABC-type transport system involved in multi-copper enzyme maturation permease subunit